MQAGTGDLFAGLQRKWSAWKSRELMDHVHRVESQANTKAMS